MMNHIEMNEHDIRMMRDLMANVERGAKFLDSFDELDTPWYNKIDITNLNIADGNSCIAGQIFMNHLGNSFYSDGHFDSGYTFLVEHYFDHDYEDAAYYGFNIHPDVLASNDDLDYGDESRYEWIYEMSYFSTINPASMYEFLATEWITQIEKRKANAGEMLND